MFYINSTPFKCDKCGVFVVKDIADFERQIKTLSYDLQGKGPYVPYWELLHRVCGERVEVAK